MHCPPLAPSSAFSHFLSGVCLPLSYAFNMPRNMCEIHNNIQHLDINNNKSRKFVKHISLTCQFLFAFEEAHLLLGPWAAKTTTSKIRVKSISFHKHAWPKSISRAKCISEPPPIVAFLHTVIHGPTFWSLCKSWHVLLLQNRCLVRRWSLSFASSMSMDLAHFLPCYYP